MSGIERIAAERQRQIVEEHRLPEDDARHESGEMARAAALYAMPATKRRGTSMKFWKLWPWDKKWWKPTPDNRIRELEKAGALIAAEIDRLERIEN